MKEGKFNVILDAMHGSSGKGKFSAFLADRFSITHVSSSNFPNAGHSYVAEDGWKFVAKAIPTAAALKRTRGMGMKCYLSPGSGFNWTQLVKEWEESGKPQIFIHDRSSIVTPEHAERERSGTQSTKHVASTMQGSGAALADKIMRIPDCQLAMHDVGRMRAAFHGKDDDGLVAIVESMAFRNQVHTEIKKLGNTWLHEGSQGYALSIDHGSHFPQCTSRNCTLQAAMDHMAVPPAMVGDVYLNLRTYPIRVGNVVEDGVEKGNSGGFYKDGVELSWADVAVQAGMPADEAAKLVERERTTVTKRIRRVFTFSHEALADAVRTNGATKLIVNFIQYINWEDRGLKGGLDAFDKLSKKSREFIEKVEDTAGVPVVAVGTGERHDEVIDLLSHYS